jgi:hypothetical protein
MPCSLLERQAPSVSVSLSSPFGHQSCHGLTFLAALATLSIIQQHNGTAAVCHNHAV